MDNSGRSGVVSNAGGGVAWLLDDHGSIVCVGLRIHSNMRRQGFGRDLVERLVGLARELGAARVVLEASPGNVAARGLFVACGFRVVSVVYQLEV